MSVSGLYCRIFVDGSRPPPIVQFPIDKIIPGKQTKVVLQHNHSLMYQDRVTFVDVEGMDQLNQVGTVTVIDSTPDQDDNIYNTCLVGIDSTEFGCSGQNGYLRKVTVAEPTARYGESVNEPRIVKTKDYKHRNRDKTLHACFLALDEWKNTHGGNGPRSYNASDASEFIELAKGMYKDKDKLPFDEECARLFAFTSRGTIPPIAAFAGGICTHEAIKLVTNVGTLLSQWLFFDCSYMLGQPDLYPREEDVQPQGLEDDAEAAVIGWKNVNRIKNARVFVVGAGALGCEILKNLGLMGVGLGSNGMIEVADMDAVEVSNLSQQFMYRPEDVRKYKSVAVAEAVRYRYPTIHIQSHTSAVCKDNEDQYPEEFWRRQDGMFSALDTRIARNYLDEMCVYWSKPMFDSGTSGVIGSTHPVIPYISQCYRDTPALPEDQLPPSCAINYFPRNSVHCLDYAIRIFPILFNHDDDVVGLLDDDQEFGGVEPCTSFAECIEQALAIFSYLFVTHFEQLLSDYPPDCEVGGKPVWNREHPVPHPASFDHNDPNHLSFVGTAACILASAYNIPSPILSANGCDIDLNMLGAILNQRSHAAAASSASSSSSSCSSSSAAAAATTTSSSQACEGGVELDKDSALHMKFIEVCTNILSGCYGFPPLPSIEIRRKSRLIEPAIVTSAASISALSVIDFLSFMIATEASHNLGRDCLSILNFRLWNIDLNACSFRFSALSPAERSSLPNGKPITAWDSITIDYSHHPNATLQQLLEDLTERFGGAEVESICTREGNLLWSGGEDGTANLIDILNLRENPRPADISIRLSVLPYLEHLLKNLPEVTLKLHLGK